jgi:hypothetical protein
LADLSAAPRVPRLVGQTDHQTADQKVVQKARLMAVLTADQMAVSWTVQRASRTADPMADQRALLKDCQMAG